MNLFDGPVSIDDMEAGRFALVEPAVSFKDAFKEFGFLSFESAFIDRLSGVAMLGAFEASSDVDIDDNSVIGAEAIEDKIVERAEEFNAQLPTKTLIRPTGIVETVAQNKLACGKCGFDDLLDILNTRCVIKQDFTNGRETSRFGIEKNLANFQPDGRAARLARGDDFNLAREQPLGHQVKLRRLAATVDSLKTDETPSGHGARV